MDKYFRTTSYALVATAFITLALTGQLDVLSGALYAAVLTAGYYKDVRGVRRKRRDWLWRILAISYIPFLAADVMVFNSRVVALVHLTLFASGIKLLQPKRDRDWIFLYLIAFFQMLLAAGLTINAVFVASLVAFLFFLISTLAAFEIRRTRREVTSYGEETVARLKQKRASRRKAKSADGDFIARADQRRRVRYLLGASFAQIVMVAAFTLPFFFLIPRFGGGAVRGSGDSQAISGFSERVELGQVASIKKSQRVVMRVQLGGPPPKYLRWRGIALESYNERGSWDLDRDIKGKRSIEIKGGARIVGGPSGEETPPEFLQPLGIPGKNSVLVEQKIFLEPLQTHYLFAAARAIKFRGPLTTISKDQYTDAISSGVIKGRIAYTITSDVSTPSEQELRSDSPELAPQEIKDIYAKLPRHLDARIRQRAREVTRGALTAYEKAKAIENYLKTQFQYSLDLKPFGDDPLYEFLFETHEGHCEYFATAMVIMLRTLDIPARIVNGFQMGEYNDVSNLYTVRESDAHSWVEVYFPRSNSWIEFDPTPSAGINDYEGGGLLAWFRKYMDALEVFWLDYVVTLDSDEQASLMGSIHRRLIAIKDGVVAYYTEAKAWLSAALGRLIIEREWKPIDALKLGAVAALLITGLLACYVIVSYRKRRHIAPTGYGPWWHRLFILPRWRSRKLIKRNRRESAVLFYEQMLATLKRAGLVKRPDQTPIEFAVRAGVGQVEEITRVYNRVRFGGGELDEKEISRVIGLLAELKRAMKKKRSAEIAPKQSAGI